MVFGDFVYLILKHESGKNEQSKILIPASGVLKKIRKLSYRTINNKATSTSFLWEIGFLDHE
jgi:hypothetical protein